MLEGTVTNANGPKEFGALRNVGIQRDSKEGTMGTQAYLGIPKRKQWAAKDP